MSEEPTQETVQENAPPEKKKKGFLKIIVIGLVAAGLAGGAGYYFYGRALLARHGGKQAADKAQEKTEVGPILPLEPFIINVSGNSSRFVKISVALELKNEKALENTKKMTPVIRDSMLAVLGAKAPDVFMDVKGRSAMKKELFDSIDRLFTNGGLTAVYITDIIMQ
ncbi:MAG: flagellar basal body-associated FliL family protein [Syntrophorhabdales bacterium]|jgi:flagellar FliL protein